MALKGRPPLRLPPASLPPPPAAGVRSRAAPAPAAGPAPLSSAATIACSSFSSSTQRWRYLLRARVCVYGEADGHVTGTSRPATHHPPIRLPISIYQHTHAPSRGALPEGEGHEREHGQHQQRARPLRIGEEAGVGEEEEQRQRQRRRLPPHHVAIAGLQRAQAVQHGLHHGGVANGSSLVTYTHTYTYTYIPHRSSPNTTQTNLDAVEQATQILDSQLLL